ncbi:Rubrerythrin [Methanohalobium evestigatum Z-7303]|uniref:Rubrerythrin n=1 Tax=Methanohalobium evestigatum (strain ATCC BAA-1072 / DSM 3721 / NBRC 107634 / OCM 161 / Z-7303) TaxID=644295 RepID=D7E8E3_METEZ|nr:Rubrerythrin [Methanohalobium evestigatum Z-7303]
MKNYWLWGESVLSEIPIDLERIKQGDVNKETLRAAIIAELDAVNLYEEMANLTENEDLKTILLDIAKEEKVHVAMFQSVLIEADDEFLKIMADYSLGKY